jgi:hypothetical protein
LPPAPVVNDGDLNKLLVRRGYLAAALELIGHDANFLVSRSDAGSCLATIESSGREITVRASTPALGVLAAMAAVILSVEES